MSGSGAGTGDGVLARWSLRGLALAYLALLLLVPLAIALVKTFDDGIGAVVDSITSPDALHALWMSLLTVAIAVPLNTVFGVGCALLLVRGGLPGWLTRGVDSVLALPFAISPIVVGLSLVLVYGETGWFGDRLAEAGVRVIFSTPGIVMAVVFVSLPFVAREVVPVLREVGDDQEQAAETLGAGPWQTFRRVTLPAIRWGVSYGVVLTTARALGEFGAVTVVSGNITGRTQTLPLYVQKQFETFDTAGAYAATLVLALLAIAALLSMNLIKRKED